MYWICLDYCNMNLDCKVILWVWLWFGCSYLGLVSMCVWIVLQTNLLSYDYEVRFGLIWRVWFRCTRFDLMS